jgi:hypothetical protein
MKPNLPGLPTFAALMLSAVLVAWLGLWGPIDFSRLQNWQTLTGAILALIAAGIAYHGATAKVRYDREVLAAENRRRKLALYLKIEMALRELREKADWKEAILAGLIPPTEEEGDRFFSPDVLFGIEEPPELEEAWTYLDLFPSKTLAEIRNIRIYFRKLTALENRYKNTYEGFQVQWRVNGDKPAIMEEDHQLMYGIWQSSALITDALEPLIKEMAPEMEENERMIRLHGEPTFHSKRSMDEQIAAKARREPKLRGGQ